MHIIPIRKVGIIDMQIFLSYFYAVRFFKPYMIPFSTAMWDPKWYHDGKSQNYIFIDKNGVINGLRADPLVPDKHCEGLCKGPERCEVNGDASSCKFLKVYMQQLESIPLHNFVELLEKNARYIMERAMIPGDPIPVILVHESPKTPCSERWPLLKWFNDGGYNVQELDFHNLP